MHAEPVLQGWEQKYQAWLQAARPLMEAGQWKDAFGAGYPWPAPAYTPWAPVSKPLPETKLAVVTTGGYYLKDKQEAFDAGNIKGDPGHRVLPVDVTPEQLGIAHTHFDHAAAEQDWNVVLPLDHLRALVTEGKLGGIGALYSISGFATDALAVAATAEQIALAAREAGCDAALLVPV